ncbi:di-heme oxidoredictase family protein [Singulisphaera rosea]
MGFSIAWRERGLSGRAFLGIGLLVVFGTAGCRRQVTDTAPSDHREGPLTGPARGREIFLREWSPGFVPDSGGDGLGPVYNDTSCVACHNAGASGGAGPASKNVEILTALPVSGDLEGGSGQGDPSQGQPAGVAAAGDGAGGSSSGPAIPPSPEFEALAKRHSGFRSASSVVLHRFGTDPNFRAWRSNLLGDDRNLPQRVSDAKSSRPDPDERAKAEIEGLVERIRQRGTVEVGTFRDGKISLLLTERNTPPLFGTGLIDAIPGEVLKAAARKGHPGFPEIKGRVSYNKGARIGRFGWKAQIASLEEFVLTACSVELGLEVPGHSQAAVPNAPGYKAPGFDLEKAESEDLIGFVRSLPAPEVAMASGDLESRFRREGRDFFEAIGCATCHTPTIGAASGIYSDLLLHDMGQDLGDSGVYGSSAPDSVELATVGPAPPIDLKNLTGDMPSARPKGEEVIVGAKRVEWRTPPLWGFRDSGPYLHDGRAETLEEAVALHGGEATMTSERFFRLPHRSRLQIEAFLKSLIAPTPHASTVLR